MHDMEEFSKKKKRSIQMLVFNYSSGTRDDYFSDFLVNMVVQLNTVILLSMGSLRKEYVFRSP